MADINSTFTANPVDSPLMSLEEAMNRMTQVLDDDLSRCLNISRGLGLPEEYTAKMWRVKYVAEFRRLNGVFRQDSLETLIRLAAKVSEDKLCDALVRRYFEVRSLLADLNRLVKEADELASSIDKRLPPHHQAQLKDLAALDSVSNQLRQERWEEILRTYNAARRVLGFFSLPSNTLKDLLAPIRSLPKSVIEMKVAEVSDLQKRLYHIRGGQSSRFEVDSLTIR
ncbi:hypothetical protein L227DRAFT_568644 [Lentinus tigrinus ALCF2SS1-6]|uniref:Uncharacterized protein n=1 Tax=Lentinus tigrinus ALCF2SS1-6 TaxID=1328759 RepID=A0A5C2RLB0_9APHY|nr:hypothetical protein L227DRAFT_568644 [Lentinus tigrinus ALCF2SS1-6]